MAPKNLNMTITAKSHPVLFAKLKLNATEQMVEAANTGYIGADGIMLCKYEAARQYVEAKNELESLWLTEVRESINEA